MTPSTPAMISDGRHHRVTARRSDGVGYYPDLNVVNVDVR
jgi:hypothetical protein